MQGLNLPPSKTVRTKRAQDISELHTHTYSLLSLLINLGLYLHEAKQVPRKGGMLTCPLSLHRAQRGQQMEDCGPQLASYYSR